MNTVKAMENFKSKPIFYFSGTGGCLATARRIAREIPEYSLVPIAAQKEAYTVDADAAGFVFPLYFSGLPRIVADFVRNIQFKQPCYIFAVVPCGLPWTGYALHQLQSMLKKKGQKLSTGFYLKMVDSYLPKFDPPKGEKLDETYRNVEIQMKNIIKQISARKTAVQREKPSTFLIYNFYSGYRRAIRRYGRYFTTDGRCNGCGICQKICPVENVRLKDGRPEWGRSCEFCLACISFCPQKTIQWKNVTQKKGRYHYKGITANDIIRQKQKV